MDRPDDARPLTAAPRCWQPLPEPGDGPYRTADLVGWLYRLANPVEPRLRRADDSVLPTR